ncbi:hypothetical protein AVEN_57123-1 [Araneus ventricosus]|uniref:Uncharacterized protein n=1 Tax=Araneus ventricosus TaxID=182803 RepID=A0A4Y2H5Y0_ARAVE|nr:hypothetical protein AVEN_57123-1 [Araneus ventricosus]
MVGVLVANAGHGPTPPYGGTPRHRNGSTSASHPRDRRPLPDLLLTNPSDLNQIHEVVRPHHFQHEIRSLKQAIIHQGNTVKQMLRSGLNYVALCADIELLITTRESEGF